MLKRRLLSALVGMTLLASTVLNPAVLKAAPQPPFQEVEQQGTPSHLEKLDADVLKEIQEKNSLGVIVFLRDQLSPELFKASPKIRSLNQTDPVKARGLYRRDFVEALKRHAQKTQRPILSLAQKEKKAGRIKTLRSYHIINALFVEGTPEAIQSLAKDPSVLRVYKNQTHQMDPLEQKKLERIEEDGEVPWHVKNVQAPEVWNIGLQGQGVVVANLDSGVQWDHPALKENYRGYDPKTGTVSSKGNWLDTLEGSEHPSDGDGHGTHTMGSMVGRGSSDHPAIGVAPGAQWIAAKIFNAKGFTTDEVILGAGEWLLAPDGNPDLAPDIVNNSWGGSAGMNDWFRGVVKSWEAAGIFTVFAAGNQRPMEPSPWPGSITCPANYPESFAVAAVDQKNQLGYFSKLGPSPYNPEMIKPEVSAPGVDVLSSLPGNKYGLMSGTSMSAPHVAGVAALLKSANETITVTQMREALTSKATPLTNRKFPNSPNMGFGYGIVNAFESVKAHFKNMSIIKGQILMPGIDGKEPVITHTPPVTQVFSTDTVHLTARIQDDVSVPEAWIEIREKDVAGIKKVAMVRTKGTLTDGTYEGFLKNEDLKGRILLYRIAAKDFAGNVVYTQEQPIEVTFGFLADAYHTDFGENAPGWTAQGHWKHTKPQNYSAHLGEKVFEIGLPKDLGESDNILRSAPLDLRNKDLRHAVVKFWHQFNLESPKVMGTVWASADFGKTWDLLYSMTRKQSSGWEQVALNLTPYLGSSNPIQLAFQFSHTAPAEKSYWVVDDLSFISKESEAPMPPKNLKATQTIHGVYLNWNPVGAPDLLEYQLRRSSDEQAPMAKWKVIGSTKQPFFNDEKPLDGKSFYKVLAVDMTGNLSEPSEAAGVTVGKVQPIYHEDFEKDNGQFVTGVIETGNYNNNWEWGVATCYPFGNQKLWGTGLEAGYDDNHRGYIQSPEVKLPEKVLPVLSLRQWIMAEINSIGEYIDYGYVQISDNHGLTWRRIGEKFGGDRGVWEDIDIPLQGYAGKSVLFRLVFITDRSEERLGWFVDAVTVAGLPVTTTNLAMTHRPAHGMNHSVEAKQSRQQTLLPMKDLSAKPELKRADRSEKELTSSVPALHGRIIVPETGRSAKARPEDGKYLMYHMVPESGELTLRAEAYGCYPLEKTIQVHADAPIESHFLLKKIPQSKIRGKAYDRYYKNPAVNVTVRFLDDPLTPAATTDEHGFFQMPAVYIGEHTLRLEGDGFEPETRTIQVREGEELVLDVPMPRKVSQETVLQYDQGPAVSGLRMNDKGSGFMTLFKPVRKAHIQSAELFFLNNTSLPQDAKIGVTLYEADSHGRPRERLFDPLVITAKKGEWNRVDLSSFQFTTDQPFFIATVQMGGKSDSPALGIDATIKDLSPYYMHLNGTSFIRMSDQYEKGGLMMRAAVEYFVLAPQITNLKETTYTKEKEVLVAGAVDSNCSVNLYAGDKIYQIETKDKVFQRRVPLLQEVTKIKATCEIQGKETEPSAEKTVIYDPQSPKLLWKTPENGAALPGLAARLTGVLKEKNLESLQVNGQPISLTSDGSFDLKLVMNPGENLMEIVAKDKAGNETREKRTVTAPGTGQESLKVVAPSRDVLLREKETLNVKVQGPRGLKAEAQWIRAFDGSGFEGPKGFELKEGTPGVYEAFWTREASAPKGTYRLRILLKKTDGSLLQTLTDAQVLLADQVSEERIFGATRVETSLAIAQALYKKADTVLLAGATHYPDALCAGPLAYAMKAPLLLSSGERDLPVLQKELTRLSAKKVILLGGEGVHSKPVEERLHKMGYQVERIAGATRYETGLLLADALRALQPKGEVLLISGESFADGLSAGAVAAAKGHTILLSTPKELSKETKERLLRWKPQKVTLVGGEQSLSKNVEETIRQLGLSVERIAGANRYETNQRVMETYMKGAPHLLIATGQRVPDALCSASLAAFHGAALFLTDQKLSKEDSRWLKEQSVHHATFLGGDLSVPKALRSRILSLLNE
ncbi:bacillopeptidase F [Clostridiaceae bacterium JG1575]|nr:bacillopeptidase F [Clostridiaceae bacterium JG1575]